VLKNTKEVKKRRRRKNVGKKRTMKKIVEEVQ